jgi:hypothetical protein
MVSQPARSIRSAGKDLHVSGVLLYVMADLTQADIDALLAMEKFCRVLAEYDFPGPGSRIEIPLESDDASEKFLLDIGRARIKLSKATFQNRARTNVILARLDIDGAPHRNPDGQEFPCPHLHIYRAGDGDRWAQPLPPGVFSDVTKLRQTFHEFMAWCNVKQTPKFRPGLDL